LKWLRGAFNECIIRHPPPTGLPIMIESLSAALEGRYEIREEIGRGGMASVYLAEDLRHGREVALKVMHPEFAHTVGPERFLKEIGYVAKLNHPKIVPLFDSGEAGGLLYYTMPYLPADDLQTHVRAKTQLPVDEALKITMDVCDALTHAHDQKLIHRDIKPSNILLSGGHALVMDFGIARGEDQAVLTATGVVVGTPKYMSPEQGTNDPIDRRTDVYSLGCVLYEMLVGTAPFDGPTAVSIQARHLMDRPPSVTTVRSTVPPVVEAALMKALEKAPVDRFQTTEEFRAELDKGLSEFQTQIYTAVRPPVKGRMTRYAWRLGVVAGVVGVAFGGWLLGSGGAIGRTDAASVAVLAFEDLSTEGGSEYLGDGIAEELIMGLASVNGLRVAARTSAFAFKTRDAFLPEIGEALRVAHILEGSIRRTGDSLQVSVRLIRASDESQLWSDTYLTSLSRVSDVQDLVAMAVVDELGVTLDEDRARLMAQATANAQAYDLYLQGRFYMNSRSFEMGRAIPLFAQATELDPDYARAHAAMAFTHSLIGLYNLLPPDSVFPLAQAEAARSLAIEPEGGEALAAMGLTKMIWEWDWPGAGDALQRAIAAEPNNAQARSWYVLYLVVTEDDPVAALEHAHLAVDSDPLSYAARITLGQTLMRHGRPEEAIQTLEEALVNEPASSQFVTTFLAAAYGDTGRWDRALELFEPLVEELGRRTLSLSVLATFYARSGRIEDAAAIMDEMLVRGRRERITSLSLAHGYAAMGRRDEAFEMLDEALRVRESVIISLRWFPELRDLADDPRYDAIMRRVGLDPSTF
jgi:eukaryotic-like serine/threonine-protein kinase